MEITRADKKEIPLIRRLAFEIWNAHYPAIIGQKQVDYMLDMMYSESALTEQMEKGHIFYLVKDKNEWQGFISVGWTNEKELYLHKFYVRTTEQGRGLGAEAWKEVMNDLKPNSVTLNVNRFNYKSINFYFKMGFKITRTVNFDIGNNFVMEDFEMVCKTPIAK